MSLVRCFALVSSLRKACEVVEYAAVRHLPLDTEPVLSLAILEAQELAEVLEGLRDGVRS